MSNPAAENSVAGKPLDSLTREEALAELRAVREREANLRSMIEAFRDVAYRIHWPTRSFRYISPASHSMLGFGFEEIVEMTPKGFFRRIHPDDKPRFRHFFGLFVKSQPGRTIHSRTSYRWRRKDGEHIWVQDMRNLLYDANGAPEFIVGSLRDITETRLVRMELQQSEERYRDLIELSPLGIAEIDTEGIVRFCNKGMGQMQGEAPERLIGLPIWDFLSPRENKAALEALIRRLVADMPPPEPFYCENMACDGRLYRVRVDWAYKRDSGGRCGGFIAMATDITEAQRSSESLERRDAILESVSFAARRFIGVDNWETCAQEVLANLGRGAQVDRVCLYERLEPANPETVISLRFEWNSEAFSFMRGNPVLKRFPMRARGFGRWADEMLADRIVSGATRSLPEPESAFLARQGILSIAAAPIRIGSEWWGIVVFDDCMREREWSAAEIEAIRAASGLFSAAIRSTFAARALRNAEIRFREMIQSIPVGLYRTTPGPEGRHLMANPALARLFGYDDPEELLHVPVAAMYANPCERKAFSDKLLRQGHVAAEPMKLKKRDGATIWCALTAKTICDEAGNPLYFDGMVEDISEQKRMEESLRHSERMARSLMDAFPEPAMLVDPRGDIIAANRAATLEMRRGRAGSSPSAAAQGLPAADAFDWLAPAAAAERQAIFERCLRPFVSRMCAMVRPCQPAARPPAGHSTPSCIRFSTPRAKSNRWRFSISTLRSASARWRRCAKAKRISAPWSRINPN